jgi:hypothetical protein
MMSAWWGVGGVPVGEIVGVAVGVVEEAGFFGDEAAGVGGAAAEVPA